jgi:hypothetical protein
LADFDAELEQFTMDPIRGAPRGVWRCSSAESDELLDVPMGVRISNAKAK